MSVKSQSVGPSVSLSFWPSHQMLEYASSTAPSRSLGKGPTLEKHFFENGRKWGEKAFSAICIGSASGPNRITNSFLISEGTRWLRFSRVLASLYKSSYGGVLEWSPHPFLVATERIYKNGRSVGPWYFRHAFAFRPSWSDIFRVYGLVFTLNFASV